MTLLENIQWGTSPTITGSISYEKQRNGADMQYRVQITINAVTGQRFFGYPIYTQISLDGLQKDTHTIKDASPSQWSTARTYTTPWITASGKTTGTTTLKVRIYSGMGTTRDISYSYSLPVDQAASVVSAPDGTMGQNMHVTITGFNENYKYLIKYSFGNENGIIRPLSEMVAASYEWKIPIQLANQIPDSTSGTGTVTLYTYSGNTLLGSTSDTFKASLPESVVPTINSVTITNSKPEVDEQFHAYIQGKSKLKVVTQATGAYNSTISKVTVLLEGTEYNGTDVTTKAPVSSGTIPLKVTATDTRGRTATSLQEITVVAYQSPQITNLKAYRATSNGTAADDGTYLKYKFKYNIASVNNLNTKTVRIQYKLADATSWTTIKTFTTYQGDIDEVSTSPVLSVDHSYNVRVIATDFFETVRRYLGEEIPTSGDVFDIYYTGKGFAFGKAAENEILEVSEDWPVLINNYAAPTWTAPSVYSSRCTVNSGGYAQLGKKVEVQMQITISDTGTEGYMRLYMNGLPHPAHIVALSVARVANSTDNTHHYNCAVNKNGEIYIGFGLTSGTVLGITGYYWTA